MIEDGSLHVEVAIDIDQTNAYYVTFTDLGGKQHAYTCYTNKAGKGLWIDGEQVLGTSQFYAGKNPREAIRRYFKALAK